MKQNKSVFFFLLLFFITIASSTSLIAQEPIPSALFIRLSTGQSRITRYEATHNPKASLLKVELAKIAKVIRNDFRDNFHLMPVYFFYDTDLSKITDRQFSGVLMDATLQPLPDGKVPPVTIDFLIAYFGNTPALIKVPTKDSFEIITNYTHIATKGLMVLDSKGDLKQEPFPYFIGKLPYKLGVPLIGKLRLYNYFSASFDEYYQATASELQDNLRTYYRKKNQQ